ncbi:MAG: hypothetical protein ACOY3L_13910 [Pseudomonadota bacterium]
MIKTNTLCFLLAASFLLQACVGPAGIAVAGVTAATFVVDRKLPPDYVAGWVTSQDCSSLEAEKTGDYCRSPEEIAAAEAAANRRAPPNYCYRTLGLVDCAAAPLVGEQARLVQ